MDSRTRHAVAIAGVTEKLGAKNRRGSPCQYPAIGKRALPDSGWTQHGAKDGGGNRADPTGHHETRPIHRKYES